MALTQQDILGFITKLKFRLGRNSETKVLTVENRFTVYKRAFSYLSITPVLRTNTFKR